MISCLACMEHLTETGYHLNQWTWRKYYVICIRLITLDFRGENGCISCFKTRYFCTVNEWSVVLLQVVWMIHSEISSASHLRSLCASKCLDWCLAGCVHGNGKKHDVTQTRSAGISGGPASQALVNNFRVYQCIFTLMNTEHRKPVLDIWEINLGNSVTGLNRCYGIDLCSCRELWCLL